MSKWKLLIFPLNLFLPQPSLIFINGNLILPVAQPKSLGVILDFSFSCSISPLVSKYHQFFLQNISTSHHFHSYYLGQATILARIIITLY